MKEKCACQTYCISLITSPKSVWCNRRNRSPRRSRAIARRSDLSAASLEHPCRGGGGDGDGGGGGRFRIVPRDSHSGSPSDLLLWRLSARKYQRSLLPYRRHCNETGRRWVSSDHHKNEPTITIITRSTIAVLIDCLIYFVSKARQVDVNELSGSRSYQAVFSQSNDT